LRNALAPSKRPYATIMPAMATCEDGILYARLSVMGGFMQPEACTQVEIVMSPDPMDPQAPVDPPRSCLLGE